MASGTSSQIPQVEQFKLATLLRIRGESCERHCILCVCLFIWLASIQAFGAESAKEFNLTIPSARADVAIKALSRQTGHSAIFQSVDVAGIETNSLKGRYTLGRALDAIFQGTSLVGSMTPDGVITVSRRKSDKNGGEQVNTNKKKSFILSGAAVLFSSFLGLPQAAAQDVGANSIALEEVVVTAQRREQSLQEVPISIETIGGADIRRQGYRDMIDLSNFSASVIVSPSVSSQEVRIRGFGSSGRTLTIEPAVPTFLDGIYYGRASEIKTAFLDAKRVEVLKGPQPVYFGQNATAGAFNIESNKPTDTWQGYTNLSYGNHGDRKAEAAVGGPITDTIGIRVAGKYESSTGYMKDLVTEDSMGRYNDKGGRIILQWKPTESIEITGKFELSSMRDVPETTSICLTDGPLIYGRKGPTDHPNDSEAWQQAMWAEPPKGVGTDVPHHAVPTTSDCFQTNWGTETHYEEPPVYIRNEKVNTGMLDIRKAADVFARVNSDAFSAYDGASIIDNEVLDSHTGYFDFKYRLDNGIEIQSLTGYNRYLRNYVRGDNSYAFLFGNYQNREEDLHQWSSELRFTSAQGGRIEWMAGAYWQKDDLNAFSSSLRANVYRGQRFNTVWQDTEWKSAFANITFNFLDNKASIDLGGRYTDIKKTGYARGYGATWIYDVTPCAPTDDDYKGGGNFDPATCPVDTEAVKVDPATDNPIILTDNVDMTNLWTIPFHTSRDTPSSWRGPRADAVGLTAPDYSVRNGPYKKNFDYNAFDPQITLRYRLGENYSFYARWAQAFKGGGFDTGLTSLPDTIDQFSFGPEQAESYEIGAKGRLWNGRARFEVSLFQLTFNDLQLTTAQPSLDDASANVNAGQQRTRGLEFNIDTAVTRQLTLGLSGALMDGVMTDYPNAGCTLEEFQTAPESGCDTSTGLIDRSGQPAPYTPDYKFVLDVDYRRPVFNIYQITFHAKGYVSDGYLTDVEGFSKKDKWNKHGDLNLSLGFGNEKGTWMLVGYARNILEARPSYNPKHDIQPDGFESTGLSSSSFLSYGLRFQYNFGE